MSDPASHYFPEKKKGRFVRGLPSFGYVYFLTNDADENRTPVAATATHVKIGASDVPERRWKSILNPVDLNRSWAARFSDWNHALYAEQSLHAHGPIAQLRDPEFLVLSEYNTAHRYREGMAGKDEWFQRAAFKLSLRYLHNTDFRSVTKWSRLVPAWHMIQFKDRPQLESKSADTFNNAAELLKNLVSMGAHKTVVERPGPVLDDYSVYLTVPTDPITQKWTDEATRHRLVFPDGVGFPMLGPARYIGGELSYEMLFLRPNAIERGRELDTAVRLALAGLAAPSFEKISRSAADTAKTAHISARGGDTYGDAAYKVLRVNGHLSVHERTNRWYGDGEPHPILLPAEELPQTEPAPKPRRDAKDEVRRRIGKTALPGLFDDPA